MKHIPSNFTLAETVKYCELPTEVSDMFEKVLDTMAEKDNQLDRLARGLEEQQEQVYVSNVLLEKILEACLDTTTHRELVKFIHILVEDSGVEL